MTRFPPRAFLIGARKSGTTTLAYLLAEHPEITIPEMKDTLFFTRNWSRGLDWYRTCFEEPHGKILLDAAPSYTNARLDHDVRPDNPVSHVPERIHDLRPDALFIYILRDPVERAYSSYWHDVRSGYEKRPFAEVIKDGTSSCVRASDYAGQLKRYLEFFPLERFLILTANELRRDPQAVVGKCFDHFGLAPLEIKINRSNTQRHRSFVLNRAGRILARVSPSGKSLKYAARAVRALTPYALHDRLRAIFVSDIPKISDQDRDYLKSYFAGRNEEFARLTGISLDSFVN